MKNQNGESVEQILEEVAMQGVAAVASGSASSRDIMLVEILAATRGVQIQRQPEENNKVRDARAESGASPSVEASAE